jgi:hypothetical protein
MCSLYLHKRTGIRTKAAEDLGVWGIYGRDCFLLPAAAQTAMPPDKEGYKGKELAGGIPLCQASVGFERTVDQAKHEDRREVVGELSGTKCRHFERQRCLTAPRAKETCLTACFSHKHNTAAPFLILLLCSLTCKRKNTNGVDAMLGAGKTN